MGFLMAALIIFISSLVQGLTGFGFSVVALPLLSLIMDIRQIVPSLVIYSIVLNVMVLANLLKYLRPKQMLLLAVFGLVGIRIGIWLLASMDPGYIKIAAGIGLFLYSIALLTGFKKNSGESPLTKAGIGLLSGILGGATSLSGPPIVLFLADKVEKQVFRANLTAYFFILNIFSIPAYISSGIMTKSGFIQSLKLIPAVIIGVYIGIKLGDRVDEKKFKKGVLYFIAVFSLTLLL